MTQTLHLNEKQLAARWGMSHRTLQGWRWRGVGPTWIKLGGHVSYPLREVERYEAEHRHQNTVGPLPVVVPEATS